MHVDYDVPFVGNAPQGMHCFSASLAMMLAHFVPGSPAVLEVGNRISSKPRGRAAWPVEAPLWLQRHGFDVGVVFDFDYEAVAISGVDYIRKRYGDEVAAWQEKNTAIPGGSAVRAFLDEVHFERRVPDFADVAQALVEEKLVMATLNSRRLDGRDGYSNHAVIVKGITDTELIVHDPGPPSSPNQRVSHDDFMVAWSSPATAARYVLSVGRSLERPIDVEAVLAVARSVEPTSLAL